MPPCFQIYHHQGTYLEVERYSRTHGHTLAHRGQSVPVRQVSDSEDRKHTADSKTLEASEMPGGLGTVRTVRVQYGRSIKAFKDDKPPETVRTQGLLESRATATITATRTCEAPHYAHICAPELRLRSAPLDVFMPCR